MNDNADVEIFMKSLLNKSGSNVDQEYLEIHNEYKKCLGTLFLLRYYHQIFQMSK